MIKTRTIETVEEFDENGKLIRKTTTETEETDDNPTRYNFNYIPNPNPLLDTGFRYNPGPSIVCKNGE